MKNNKASLSSLVVVGVLLGLVIFGVCVFFAKNCSGEYHYEYEYHSNNYNYEYSNFSEPTCPIGAVKYLLAQKSPFQVDAYGGRQYFLKDMTTGKFGEYYFVLSESSFARMQLAFFRDEFVCGVEIKPGFLVIQDIQ